VTLKSYYSLVLLIIFNINVLKVITINKVENIGKLIQCIKIYRIAMITLHICNFLYESSNTRTNCILFLVLELIIYRVLDFRIL